MNRIKKLFTLLLVSFIALQPLSTVNAMDEEVQTSSEIFSEVSEIITEFQLENEITNQETTVGSDYALELPESITAVFSVVDEEGNIVEASAPATKDVVVTWTEIDAKEFSTENAGVYTYQASLVNGANTVITDLTMPVINVEVIDDSDKTAPVITAANAKVEIGDERTINEIIGLSVIDDVDGDITENAVVTSTVKIDVVGNYIVSIEATDANGNSASMGVAVEVSEKESAEEQEEHVPQQQSIIGAIASNAKGDIFFRSSQIPFAPADDPDWTWDYAETPIPNTNDQGEGGSFSMVLGVIYDATLEPGSKRVIEVNIDQFNNGEYHALKIANASFNSEYIDSDQSYFTSDKIVYVINNDLLQGAEAAMSFSIGVSSAYDGGNTNYYITEGTIASAVGYMLLNNPNGDLGTTVREYQQGTDPRALSEEAILEDSEVTLKHTIRRDNHGTQPIISEFSVIKSDLSVDVTDKPITDLWLGVDGHLYYTDTTTGLPINSQSYGYAFRFTEEDHAPVGDFTWSISMPEEIPIMYSTTQHIPYSLTIDESTGTVSVIDMIASTTMNNGWISTGNIKSFGEMFTGVKAASTQVQFAFRNTGTGNYGPRGPYALHTYTENGTYESETITAQYNQVVPDTENGGYKIEQFTQEFGNLVIHVPEYIYEDKIIMEASIPEKVNYDDPTGMEYNFSIYNNVSSTDIYNNKAPYFHNGGVMTMSFADENFDPHTITLNNTYGEFVSYQVVYADGTLGPIRNVSSKFTVDTLPNLAGAEVTEVKFNISEQGLVKDGYATNYSSSGLFTGEFTEPTEVNSIKVDVNFSSDGNGTNATPVSFDKEITWEYQPGTDYLHLYQEFDDNSILVNDNLNSTGVILNLGAAIPADILESSVIYRNVRVNMFDTSLATDANHAKEIQAILAQGGYTFNFNGTDKSIEYNTLDEPDAKVWVEYTTNLDSNPKKQYLDTSTSEAYTISLQEGEYFTSLQFCADRLRLLGYDATNISSDGMNFDLVYFITNFRFNAIRHDDVDQITPSKNIIIPAQITADGLGDTWTPPTGTSAVDVNNTKRFADDYHEIDLSTSHNYVNLRYTATLNPSIITDSITGKVVSNTLPTATSTNGLLATSGSMTINLPTTSGMLSNTHSDIVYYPEGTKAYLQLNTEYFKYIGDNERIQTRVIDGKTFLIYDLAGLQNHTASFSIDNDDFWVTNNLNSPESHSVFLDSYFDIGPILDIKNTERPYYNYVASSNLEPYLSENPYNLESVAAESSAVNRFVEMNVSTTTKIDIAASTNIFLYPGIEDKVEHIESVSYKIHDASTLKLGVDVGSTDRSFTNYHMVIELPRSGVTYKNQIMSDAVESEESIYIRELSENAVSFTGGLSTLKEENKPIIQYAQSVTFNEASAYSEIGSLTPATSIYDARYVVVSFPTIPQNLFGTVELSLTGDLFIEHEGGETAKENHTLYDAQNGAKSYANVQSRFEYTTTSATEGSYNIGTGYSVKPAEFIFEYVVVSGKVFEEDTVNYPDGILNNSDFEYNASNIVIKNLNQLDETGNPVIMEVEPGADGTGYQVVLPPIKTEDGEAAPYNLFLDLEAMGKSGTHTLTKNASSAVDVENNNNAPRVAPGDTPIGIPIYTDEDGYTSIRSIIPTIPLVTDFELENGYVDFGIYKNPTVTVSPSRVTVPEGGTANVTVSVNGVGTILDTGYAPVEGNEYVDVTTEMSGDRKTANVILSGTKATLDGADENIYLSANTKILNYFGEEIEGPVSEYLVYERPSVTFHPYDKTDSTIVGSWNDGSADPSKNVVLNPLTGKYESGSLSIVDVPLITPPTGGEDNLAFECWQLENGTKVYFDTNQKEFPDNTNLYPVFSVDNIVDPNNDLNGDLPGDGIADVFQTVVHHEVTNGTWDGETETPTTTSQVVTFIKDRQPSINGIGYYTVPEATPTPGYTNGHWNGSTSTGTLSYTKTEKTFYYEFEPYNYNVNFDANGGSGTMDSQEMEYAVPEALNTNTFTKEGHTFIGWATEPTGEVVYTNNQEVENLVAAEGEEETLYAVWEADINEDGIPDKYQSQVTYNTVHGTWDGTETTQTVWITYYKDGELSTADDAQATLTPPTSIPNDGYHGGIWNVPVIPTTVPKSAGAQEFTYTHVHAQPEVTQAVTNPGGIAPETDAVTVKQGGDVTLTATGSSFNADPEDLTYQWYKKLADGTYEEVTGETGITFTPPTDVLGNETYSVEITDTRNGETAMSEDSVVTVAPYAIIFVPNGGTFTDGTTANKVDLTTQEKVVTNDVDQPTKAGNVFAGWTIEGVDGTFTTEEIQNYVFPGDKTVTAVWLEDILVDNDKDTNGSNIGDGIPDVYQTTVTHVVENGTWDGETELEVNEVVTFYKDGELSNASDASAEYDVPTSTGNSGYTNGAWQGDTSTGIVTGFTADEVIYEYAYGPIVPTVSQVPTAPESVSIDSESVTVQKDKDVTLTATGVSEGATDAELTYQWYIEQADGSLVEIPGETGSTYMPDVDVLGETKYVVTVTDTRNDQTATSNTVTVEVVPYTVTFVPDGGIFTDGTTDNKTDVTTQESVVTNDVEEPVKPGNVFGGWLVEGETTPLTTEQLEAREFTEDTTVTAVWLEDILVDNDKDTDVLIIGDGIPDIYQTTVTHVVENGTWDGETELEVNEVVTFYKDGELSNASDASAEYDVPTSTGNSGYTNGAWQGDTSTGTVTGFTADEVIYEYAYGPIVPTVSQVPTAPESVSIDSESVTVQKDKDVTLTATGVSEGATDAELTYQWYIEQEDGSLVEIPGETGSTYMPDVDVLGETKYVVTVTDTRNDQTATSNTVTVEVVPYTVTFVPDGGTFTDGTTDNKTDVTTQEKVVTNDVDQPTKPGNVFGGWLVEGETTPLTTEQLEAREFTEDTTVTAVWLEDILVDNDKDTNGPIIGDGIPDIYQTTVTHVVENGTWDGETELEVNEVVTFYKDGELSNASDASAEYDVPTSTGNSGYTNGAWQGDTSTGTVTGFTADEVIYEYAYVPNNYTVIFDGNTTDVMGSTPNQEMVYDVEESLETNGYFTDKKLFLGWSTDPLATEAEYVDQETVMNLTTEADGNVTLYAVWETDENNDGIRDMYQTKVVYKIVNGTWSGRAMKDDVVEWITFYKDGELSIEPDAKGVVSNTPEKMFADTGYDQNTGEWDETPITEIPSPTREVFVFTYTFAPMLKVTYPSVPEVEGGIITTETFEIENEGQITINNDNGEDIYTSTLLEDTTLTAPSKEGHTFLGYEYNPETRTFTATWSINEYTVTYEENGGTDVEDQTSFYGEDIIQPSIPTKPGFTFEGWYLDPEFTQKFDFETMTMPANDFTLYAKYTANPVITEPQTGDNTTTMMWSALLLLSAVSAIIVLKKSKKEENA